MIDRSAKVLTGTLLSAWLGFCSASEATAQTILTNADFEQGTYIIDTPGLYELGEDISFNPHPVGSPGDGGIGTLDAYDAGRPFPSQFGVYDPSAFGIGFFAAIAVAADDVTIDLKGYTIEQSAEHALHQRFFAVIETADRPFVPNQGPHDFGASITAANRLTITNGTIGRSSHHGIHGNNNVGVTISNIDFVDYEVAAIHLNKVTKLNVKNCTGMNREDVPVLGTFSNARFISAYVDCLVDTASATTLTVGGVALSATDIQTALRDSINNVYEDVITDGLGIIDESEHPDEFALFHNREGVVDGNAYGFAINGFGVAVNGFPESSAVESKNIKFKNVHVLSQKAWVNEVIALSNGSGGAANDPIGAVLSVRNVHPDTGAPVTMSTVSDDASATYTGNVVANAQALVAKAELAGDFASCFLDVSRQSITQEIIDWIENEDTLADLLAGPTDEICNGDTMFHVQKGVIGFKLDGGNKVKLSKTSVSNLDNLGGMGSEVCGNYVKSHPAATLEGYGGARVRGYSVSGSTKVTLKRPVVTGLAALNGSVYGIDVLTDSSKVTVAKGNASTLDAGAEFVPNLGPNETPDAYGLLIGADTKKVKQKKFTSSDLIAVGETATVKEM